MTWKIASIATGHRGAPKDLVICHLREGATLNKELTTNTRKSYVPLVRNRSVDAPIGLIPVTSV